ncbi:MAG: tRNA pseudouridine(55) synthase TruB [Acidimicrobiia bacterium]|nr:tRNA pseudouridine(55) synthase TruB [Acidimicrobiia bacterium]
MLVDKPSGWTSHDVVAKTRGILRERKVGHAGTLDPMATGLLVLAVGRVTRLLRFLQDLPKVYEGTMMLGVATDTLDADGAVLSREEMPVSQAEVEAAMKRFVGDIHQVPPMVSALKIDGRRLHELAREGKEVERAPRPVTIHDLEMTDFSPSNYPEVGFRVTCSKGTYVRTLADDIGRSLGGHAHLTELRRTNNGSLSVSEAVSIEQLQAHADAGTMAEVLLTPASALRDVVGYEVDEPLVGAVRNGVAIAANPTDVSEGSFVRVMHDGELLAMYRSNGSGLVAEVVLS